MYEAVEITWPWRWRQVRDVPNYSGSRALNVPSVPSSGNLRDTWVVSEPLSGLVDQLQRAWAYPKEEGLQRLKPRVGPSRSILYKSNEETGVKEGTGM